MTSTVTEVTRDAAYHEDPVARHLRDLVAPRQIVALRRLAAERGFAPGELNDRAVARYSCRVEELTSDAAEHLRWLLEGGAIRPRAATVDDADAYCSFGERPEVSR